MGTRDSIFNRPVSTVVDFVWVEVSRAASLLGNCGFPGTFELGVDLKSLSLSLAPMVDQRLVVGDRSLYDIPLNERASSDDQLCEAWNIVRASLLWVLPKVESGKMDPAILTALLKSNQQLARIVRSTAPVAGDGSERFSAQTTTECNPMVTLKALRQGFVSEYAAAKSIPVGQVPLAVISKQWAVPLFGWTLDLAEEAGRVLGDIAAGCERDIFLPERSTRCRLANTELAKEARQLSSAESIVAQSYQRSRRSKVGLQLVG